MQTIWWLPRGSSNIVCKRFDSLCVVLHVAHSLLFQSFLSDLSVDTSKNQGEPKPEE